MFAGAIVLVASSASAHDLERTQVALTFAGDGSFVLDVANDPNWLKLRLESIPGPFADRVVLWVDGREVRATSVEYLPADSAPQTALATHRLRGRMPLDARSLRWYYGLVIDPYPLVVHRADGRVIVEEIESNAWSGPIDLSGQFHASPFGATSTGVAIAGLLLLPFAIKLARRRGHA
jgi:hypothetical protein